MKNRTSGYSSDNEQSIKQQQDLSILRKPILTSLNGFMEVKRAFDNGTEEIRRLLSRECDILYECKICRNIFRSLTNFISHKRVYCCDFYNNSFDINKNGFIDQDVSTIIQAEEQYTNRHQTNKTSKKNIISSSSSTTNSNTNNNNNNNQQTSNNNNNNNNNNNLEKPNKDLTSIIERLINREQKNRTLRLTDFYEQVSLKLTQEEILKKNHILQLDGIPNSNAAVYQTLKIKKDDCDNIKKEVYEINDIINCDAILGPDGKLLNTNNCNDDGSENHKNNTINSTINQIQIEKDIENSCLIEKNLACDICQEKFSTKKTLKLHIQTKHIRSTYVHQCPSCSQTFLQPSAVIRHLSNDHKKSFRRIRQMRETILKKRMRMDEVQIKGPSRELARLQTQRAYEISAENEQAWTDNIERSPKNSPLCTYCGKKFERRAVLTTHLQTCMAKNRQTPTFTNKKLIDTTFSRDNSSASRSSTSSPANITNSVAACGGTSSSTINSTNSLLAFTAKSIANATFEPIKTDETKSDCCNEFFEIVKPNNDENLNRKLNKRKRRKPETIIIRKTEAIIKQPDQEEAQSNGIANVNDNDVKVETAVNVNKVEKLKLSKLSLKDVKKPKLSSSTKSIKQIQTNVGIDMNVTTIPEKTENSFSDEPKHQDKNSNALCTVLKKKDFNRDRFLKLVTPRKDLIFYCRICKKAFSALSNLRRHISMFHYRRRKFGCHICPYRAFRKYDVVNHLNSAHSLTGEENLDQILVAEDNYGKDDIDADIIISDNGEFKGEKQEDIENIKADIAKANIITKNKLNINKDENSVKYSNSKKGRKPKGPYVVKNTLNSNHTVVDSNNSDLEIVPIEEPAPKKLDSDKTYNPNELTTTIKNDEILDLEKVEKDSNNSEDMDEKKSGNIKRSDSILSISSNEDRIASTTNTNNVSACPALKRPIRNRVKPVKKDFVYDLSNFLKKDMLCVERDSFNVGKAATKRRNTIMNLDDSSRESNSSNSTISSSSSSNLHIATSNSQNLKEDERKKPLLKNTTIFAQRTSLDNNSSSCMITTKDSSTSTEKSIILTPTLLNHLKKDINPFGSALIQKDKILNINNCFDKMPQNFTNIFKSFDDLKKVKHVRRTSDDAVIRSFNKKRKSIDISDLTSMSDSSFPPPTSFTIKKDLNMNGKITDNENNNLTTNEIISQNKLENNNLTTELINNDPLGGEADERVVEIIKNVPNDIKSVLISNNKSPEPSNLKQQIQSEENHNTIKCPSDIDFQQYLLKNNLSEPVKKINLSAVLEQQDINNSCSSATINNNNDAILHQQSSLLVSGKRITLLQRLADNKSKKIQESLLRNALEN